METTVTVTVTVSGPLDERLTEMLDALLGEGRTVAGGNGAGGIRVQGKDRAWTRDEIFAIYETINPTGRWIMDLGSKVPDGWISITQISKASGLTKDSIGAGRAGLTRHTKSRYSHTEPPFRYVWGEHIGFGREMHYQVPSQIAAWWIEAQAAKAA